MTFSNQQSEWHIGTEDNADAPAWLLPTDKIDAGAAQKRFHARAQSSRHFELSIGIVMLYAVALFLVWQQVERRMTQYEAELASLQNALVQVQSEIGQPTEKEAANQERIDVKENTSFFPVRFETDHLAFEVSGRSMELIKLSYFHFGESEPTMAGTEYIAAASDARYRELLQEFGIALSCLATKPTIVIDPMVDATGQLTDSHRLIIPFETLAVKSDSTAQASITPTDRLTSEILLQLSRYVHTVLANSKVNQRKGPSAGSLCN